MAGDLEGAVRDLETALKALPRRADFWHIYADFLQRADGSPTPPTRGRGRAVWRPDKPGRAAGPIYAAVSDQTLRPPTMVATAFPLRRQPWKGLLRDLLAPAEQS